MSFICAWPNSRVRTILMSLEVCPLTPSSIAWMCSPPGPWHDSQLMPASRQVVW